MPATDNFRHAPGSASSSVQNAVAVTPHESNDLASVSRALYIGGAGNLTVTMAGGGSNVTFTAVPAGSFLPIRVSKVLATGTTATSIVALE
jgi:hypothetical protein